MPRLRWMVQGGWLLAATACGGYQSIADPGRYLAEAPVPVEEVLVTLNGNQRVTFRNPAVIGDSLRGTLPDGAQWRVALADVTRFEVPKSASPTRSRTVGAQLGETLTEVAVCVVVVVIFRPKSCTVEDEVAEE